MKNFFLLILIFGSFLTTSFGQAFRGGLQFGMTMSQVDGDREANYEKLGGSLGYMVGLNFDEDFGLLMGVEYIGKGSKIDADITNNNFSAKIALHYIQAPFMLNYQFNSIPQLKKLSVQGGIGLGVLLSGKQYQNGEEVHESTYSYKPLDFSAIGGISWHFNEQLSANFQLQYSMVHISGQDNMLHQFNNSLALSLLYYFSE